MSEMPTPNFFQIDDSFRILATRLAANVAASMQALTTDDYERLETDTMVAIHWHGDSLDVARQMADGLGIDEAILLNEALSLGLESMMEFVIAAEAADGAPTD